MRNSLITTGVLAALLAATPALSQSSTSGQPAASPPAQSETKSDSQAGTSGTTSGSSTAASPSATTTTTASTGAGSGEAFIATEEPDHMRADDLLGMEVRNPQDEKIGNVDDLILNEDMQVVGVVVGVGGFLGIGKKDVALAKDQVEIRQMDNKQVALVQMTKDQLKEAPSFKTAEQQRAEADAERARQSQGTAAGAGATGAGGAPAGRTK